MENNLYFIANEGCDATTYGIAILSDEEFLKFKAIIENLNKNSYYGCMPTVSVYKSNWDKFREIKPDPNKGVWGDDYIEKGDMFYLDDKTYTFAEKYDCFRWSESERVI